MGCECRAGEALAVAIAPKKLFRGFAVGEAVTWALLISALILRSLQLDLGWIVTLTGSIHGAMFLGYATVAALVGVNQRWGLTRVAFGVALAIVPFATVPFEGSLLRRARLDGDWRLRASDDPRDLFWVDRLFRWFIRRPLVLVLVLAAFLAVLYLTLIWLGPPSEWGTRFE